MIDLEKLSSEEKKTIEEFRERMKKDLPTNVFENTVLLYKFLKARDFNVDKAEHMMRKNISWRKHFQVDTILEDFTPKPFFEKYIQLSHLGLDKNGNIVMYIPIGKVDGRDVLKCVQSNEYMKHWIWHLEENFERMKNKPDKDKLQVTVIADLDKLTLANATSRASLDLNLRFMPLLMNNYPELLNNVYFINSPSYYVFMYSIVKTMMSDALQRKIHVFAHTGWQRKILEVIDADVLPAFLGGNRTDSDGNPLCTTFINHGGKIPELYYLSEVERDFKDRSLVKRIIIPPKQKKEIFVHVTEDDSQICWEFLIKRNDIGFGLSYKISESEFTEILPVEKCDTVDGVEKGSYKTHSNGNYFIVFDNSYSWMNSKEVEYCITVLKTLS